MKRAKISPSNPLLTRINDVPIAVHFHAWLLRRGVFYTMASAYVRAVIDLAEHFNANPADITAKAVKQFCHEQGFNNSYSATYIDAHSLWLEYWGRRDKAVPDDWVTTTGIIADVLGWKSRMVVKALKYYAIDTGTRLEEFEKAFGAKWKAYVVPIRFFRYAEKIKKEDDARWRHGPPKKVASTQ